MPFSSAGMYVKLFSSILTSSVWDQDHRVLRLWITMLALSDRNGCVYAAPNGLAVQSRLSRKEMEVALKVLASADPDDSSGQNDGRRVEKIQGGWQITNYERYRDMVDPDIRRDQTRERVRKHRAKGRSVTLGNAPKRSVTTLDDMRSDEKRSDKKKNPPTPQRGDVCVFPPELNDRKFRAAWNRWTIHRCEIRKRLTTSTIQSQLKALAKVGPNEAIARIEKSIENGWQGLFPTEAKAIRPLLPGDNSDFNKTLEKNIREREEREKSWRDGGSKSIADYRREEKLDA